MLCKAIASLPPLLSARARHISCHLFNSISFAHNEPGNAGQMEITGRHSCLLVAAALIC